MQLVADKRKPVPNRYGSWKPAGLSFPFRRLFRRIRKDRPQEHRKRNHRVTVWMHPDLYFRLLSLKTKEPYGTMTALVEAALTQFIQSETAKRAEVIPAEES